MGPLGFSEKGTEHFVGQDPEESPAEYDQFPHASRHLAPTRRRTLARLL